MKTRSALLPGVLVLLLTFISAVFLFCQPPGGLNETHEVTFSTVGGNGDITAKVDGASIVSGAKVVSSKSVVFTASPQNGYTVKEWKLNGTVLSGNMTNTYILSGLSAVSDVTVEFEEIVTHAVTFSAGANGTVTAQVGGAFIESGEKINHNSTVVFTASPQSGYKVSEWRLNDNVVNGNKTNTYTINELSDSVSVTVAFEEDPCANGGCTYAVTFGTAANGTVTAQADGVPITSGQKVEHNKTVVFTAVPDDGYDLKSWVIHNSGSVGISFDVERPVGGGTKDYTYKIDALKVDTEVTAVFEALSCVGEDCNVDDLGIANAIVITYAGSTAEVKRNPISQSASVEVNGGHVVVRCTAPVANGIDIILSGSVSDGSFKAYANSLQSALGTIRLHLNGVSIINPQGPAISFPTGKNIDSISVNLVSNKVNSLSDDYRDYAAPPEGEQAKGTFFSEAAVVFSGSGRLELRSKSTQAGGAGRHAIVVDDYFTMRSGNLVIHQSTNDGIHVNRTINITGGILRIETEGDAIQNERNFPINISGGDLTLSTTGLKSHGIACDSNDVIISGTADVSIKTTGAGAKGIRSRQTVDIRGGSVAIVTEGNLDVSPGDGDESSASGIKALDFFMSNGNLGVKSTGENSKGISVDRNAVILGGTVNIASRGDGIKTDGDLTISGGNITSKSAEKKGIDCKGDCSGCYNSNVVTDNKAGDGIFK